MNNMSELSPDVATMLRRLQHEEAIADHRLTPREAMRMKLLQRRGLAQLSNPGVWELTASGRATGVSNARTDIYELVRTVESHHFSAQCGGVPGDFQLVLCMDVSCAWSVRNAITGAEVDAEQLTDVVPVPVASCGTCGWSGNRRRVVAMRCPECGGERLSYSPPPMKYQT